MNEKEAIEKLEEMAFQSLSPELYESWLDIKDELERNRKELQDG